MIRIRANRKEGFRRCGIFHPHEAVDHPEKRFSKDELAQLMTEPMLTVEVVEASDTRDNPAAAALLEAAKTAIANGNTTSDGRPTVDAMAEIMGEKVSAADRDKAWDAIQQEEGN